MALEHIDVILSFVLIIAGVSLIITALNQAISALLGLRGSHLRWGLETLLSNIDPSLKDQARKISEEILKHPMISDSTFSGFSSRLTNRWRLATAIDKDELTGIIKLLAHSGEEDWQKALRERVSDRNVALDEALLKAFPGAGDVVDRYRRALANSATDL